MKNCFGGINCHFVLSYKDCAQPEYFRAEVSLLERMLRMTVFLRSKLKERCPHAAIRGTCKYMGGSCIFEHPKHIEKPTTHKEVGDKGEGFATLLRGMLFHYSRFYGPKSLQVDVSAHTLALDMYALAFRLRLATSRIEQYGKAMAIPGDGVLLSTHDHVQERLQQIAERLAPVFDPIVKVHALAPVLLNAEMKVLSRSGSGRQRRVFLLGGGQHAVSAEACSFCNSLQFLQQHAGSVTACSFCSLHPRVSGGTHSPEQKHPTIQYSVVIIHNSLQIHPIRSFPIQVVKSQET